MKKFKKTFFDEVFDEVFKKIFTRRCRTLQLIDFCSHKLTHLQKSCSTNLPLVMRMNALSCSEHVKKTGTPWRWQQITGGSV
jgi:sulfatase maturation enzyme AslB (radical SAM superfamily)